MVSIVESFQRKKTLNQGKGLQSEGGWVMVVMVVMDTHKEKDVVGWDVKKREIHLVAYMLCIVCDWPTAWLGVESISMFDLALVLALLTVVNRSLHKYLHGKQTIHR